MDFQDVLNQAERIIRRGGDRAVEIAGESQVRREKRHRDIVTDGDLAVEEMVISDLHERFPHHGFHSEERPPENTSAEYVWVLDPIDGTKHYARHLPYWAVSLGLEHRGEPVLGAVYLPECGRMYSAAAGYGATLNGRPIRCSSQTSLSDAFLCVEIPHAQSNPSLRSWAIDRLQKLMERTLRVRIIGAGALGLCFTAAAGFDAYVNLGSSFKKVDYAAGRVILAEAGAIFEPRGETILAGPPELCKPIRELLEE